LERVYYQNVIDENNGGIEQLRKDEKKAPGLHTPEAEEYLNEVLDIARGLDSFIKNNIAHYLTQKIVLKRIYGNLLYERVNDFTERYQEENGIIFIDELNHKISQLFEGEGEVPFVYFRMGESFKKYMIDEFQDTSMVQWKNIYPLVENAMAEGEKSITVGDLKQAIYRFRGGSTEVMSALMNNPIVERENLESNWRSDTNIIALNNYFFTGILQNTKFVPASIYDAENVKQRHKKNEFPQFSDKNNAGYCELNLINKDADMKKLMLEEGELVKIIRDILSRGYKQSSIGILVRTNSEGNEIAELLSSEDKDVRDIKILSADTLFIKDNPFVDFIVNVLKYSLDNTSNEAFVRLIHLWQDIGKTEAGYESARDFVIKTLIAKNKKYFALNKDDREEAMKLLWGGDAYSSYRDRISATINSVSVYESINLILEIIINPLCRDYSQSIAHITKLRNTAFSRMKEENTFNFLKYYDEYRDELNIPAPASKNAVTISTIHKAKGLQYDVVIVPFAKWNSKKNLKNEYFIYNDPRIAVQYGDLKKDYFEHFNDNAKMKKDKSKEETFFDDINLLYVAMTRACEELYVYSNTDDKFAEMDTIERVFTSKFLELKETGVELEEKETHEQISIGSRRTVEKEEVQPEKSVQRLTAFSHKEHMFIDRQMNYIINKHRPEEESRTHGRILHEALAGIFAEKDIEPAVHVLLTEGKITEDEADSYIKELRDIIKSSEFTIMFDRDYEVLNERNILFKGEIKRPDRVMIRDSKVLIFDYKTGGHEDEYEKQVKEYMDAYGDMGYDARGFIAYTVDKKLQEVTA
ncbi:MAG: 3'-5' exonuclease, partial [bacterium]